MKKKRNGKVKNINYHNCIKLIIAPRTEGKAQQHIKSYKKYTYEICILNMYIYNIEIYVNNINIILF